MSDLELFTHQADALKWAKGKDKVIFALDMGLGKSAIAASTILKEERVLVICPASLKINWQRELKQWSVTPRIKIIKKKSEDLPKGAGTVIINYDLLGGKVKKRAVANYDFSDFDRVIVDESHMIKNPKAIRSKIGAKIIAKTRKAVLLSGTLMERPIDLFVPLTSIGANSLRYDPFGFKYCDAQQVYLGTRTVWQFRGCSNPEGLKALMKPYTLVMKKEDVIDLPGKGIKVVALDLPVGRQEKQYNLTDILKDPRPIGFEGLAELLHEQGLRKLPLAVKHIKMRLEENDKIFITAKHTDIIDILAEKLEKFNPVIIDGRMSTDKKQAAVDIFQNDKNCRICIGQTKAAGVGLTLTAASHVILVEPDWSYSAIMQIIDRCHRISQTKDVTAELLTIANSIDERVLFTTLEKEGFVKALGL